MRDLMANFLSSFAVICTFLVVFLLGFCIIFCKPLNYVLSVCACESQDSHTPPVKPRLQLETLVTSWISSLSKGGMKASSF